MANTAITKKKKKQMVIGLVIVAILIVAFVWYTKSKKDKKETIQTENKGLGSDLSTPVEREVKDNTGKIINEVNQNATTENSATEPTKKVMDEKA